MYIIQKVKEPSGCKLRITKDGQEVNPNSLSLKELIELGVENNLKTYDNLVLPQQLIQSYTQLLSAWDIFENSPQETKSQTLRCIMALDENQLLDRVERFAKMGKTTERDILCRLSKAEQHPMPCPTRPTAGKILPMFDDKCRNL